MIKKIGGQEDMLEIINKNLAIGMVIKNYKEMCKILKQDVVDGGRNRRYQEKDWQRYFDWENSGHKYIIIDIYDEPLPKDDKRQLGNNSQYVEHIELLLLNYLSQQEGFKASFTLKGLFQFLCFCNQKYYNMTKSQIQQSCEVSPYQVNHFYQRTYQKFRDIVFSSLRNLKRRFLIIYKEVIMISRTEQSGNDKKEIILPATEQEEKDILAIKRYVLEQMGLESITQVYLKFKQDQFNSMVNHLLQQRYNINYSFTQIDMIFNHPHIIKALEQAELEMQKRELNNKVTNSVNEQAKNILTKNHKEYEEKYNKFLDECLGEPNPTKVKNLFRLDEDIYTESQNVLTDYLLKI